MDGIPETTLPVRVNLGHNGVPSGVWKGGVPVFFLTICAENRQESPLLLTADSILDAICSLYREGKWFVHLALVMPDHVHLLASFPAQVSMGSVLGDWKRYLARHSGIHWQRNFFDHRIRNVEELSEKWEYIRQNPVRKGLVETPDAWPYWIAFHPETGMAIR